MAYIGNQIDTGFTSLLKQDLTGASGTTLTLSHAVANANDIALYINNVRQEPATAYTVTNTTVNLTGTVSGTDDIYVIYLARAVQTTVPPDGSVSTAKIADDAVNLTSKVTGVLPIANGGTGNTVGSATNYVNNLTVSGTTVTAFNTILTGTALNGGCKTLKIFITRVSNELNGYMGFRTINSDDATNDGGYNSAFTFATGSTFNQNGNTDGNLAYQMAFGYYGGLYNIVIDGQLIEPSINRWAFQIHSNSVLSNTPVSGYTIGYNDLGANKPLKGFRIESTNTNGLGIANTIYGYSYTT